MEVKVKIGKTEAIVHLKLTVIATKQSRLWIMTIMRDRAEAEKFAPLILSVITATFTGPPE